MARDHRKPPKKSYSIAMHPIISADHPYNAYKSNNKKHKKVTTATAKNNGKSLLQVLNAAAAGHSVVATSSSEDSEDSDRTMIHSQRDDESRAPWVQKMSSKARVTITSHIGSPVREGGPQPYTAHLVGARTTPAEPDIVDMTQLLSTDSSEEEFPLSKIRSASSDGKSGTCMSLHL